MSSVIQYGFPTSLPWTEKLVSKLSTPAYRHAYMLEGVKTWIARQVRTLREQRDWSQEDLGRETGKPQSAISRVEDPDYGKLTLQTLFDLARAYDVPLLVQFVEWSDWLSRMNDSSTEALQKESFSAAALTDLGAGQIVAEPINQYLFEAHSQNQGVNYLANVGLLSGANLVATGTWTTHAATASVLAGSLTFHHGYKWDVSAYIKEEEEDDDF